MQDDRTVIMPPLNMGHPSYENVPITNGLQITLIDSNANTIKESTFSQRFTLGRGRDNDFRVVDNRVSRHHLRINIEYGEWYIEDLGSSNGSYLNDLSLVGSKKLTLPCLVSLGKGGLVIQLQLANDQVEQVSSEPDIADDMTRFIQQPDTPASIHSVEKLDVDDIQRRFFTDNKGNAGEYTQMVRGVILKDKKKNTKKYRWGVSITFLLLCIAIGVIAFQQISYREAALNMYYQTKSLEVDISLLEIKLGNEASSTLQDSILLTRHKLQTTQEEYRAIVDNLNALKFPARLTRVIRHKIGLGGAAPSEYERELIQKVAEKFGESQLELSDNFIAEVHRYVAKWQQSSRMKNAMARLNKNNYGPIIRAAMKKEGLPAQFLYLCLQESNFNSRAVGPATRYGIAKGAWQFLPTTGQEFGLSTGNMTDIADYDVGDERFNFSKATQSAAKYLKHIYTTEAQASGLLVMAGYNYGHNRVRRMIKKCQITPKKEIFGGL
jgi:hypothetical protein